MSKMKYDVETGHDHYGPDVKKALKVFHDSYLSYQKVCSKFMLRENYFRIDAVQAAFNALIKERREETGIASYLSPQKHKEATGND